MKVSKDFVCPVCGAPPGVSCTTRVAPHGARVALAREANAVSDETQDLVINSAPWEMRKPGADR